MRGDGGGGEVRGGEVRGGEVRGGELRGGELRGGGLRLMPRRLNSQALEDARSTSPRVVSLLLLLVPTHATGVADSDPRPLYRSIHFAGGVR